MVEEQEKNSGADNIQKIRKDLIVFHQLRMPLDSENAAILMLHGFYIILLTEGRGIKTRSQSPGYLMMVAVYGEALWIQLMQYAA